MEDEFEKEMARLKKRSEEMQNLALSIVEQMTKLGCTFHEYQSLKDRLDKLVDASKITPWNPHLRGNYNTNNNKYKQAEYQCRGVVLMAVVKEYKFEGSTVRIHDDCLLKDQKKIQEILDEIAKIYARAYERKMTEGVG